LNPTETSEPVDDPVANMAAEGARRAALLPNAVPPVETKPVAGSDAQVAVPKADGGATDKVTTGAAVTPTQPPAPPKAQAGQDVSWVPEELRSFAEKADEKGLAKLREIYFKADDYTKKTMTLAEERKQVEARKVAAEYGEAILSDPKLRRAVDEWATAEEAAKPQAAPFDYLTATSEDIAAHEAAIEQRATEKALAALRAEREQDRTVVDTMTTMQRLAVAEFVESGEYDKEAVNTAYRDLSELGVQFSPDNVVKALRRVLPKKAATPQASPPVTPTSEVPANGASALTRGAGVQPALRVPAIIRDGKTPTSRDERLQVALYEWNRARAAKGLTPFAT